MRQFFADCREVITTEYRAATVVTLQNKNAACGGQPHNNAYLRNDDNDDDDDDDDRRQTTSQQLQTFKPSNLQTFKPSNLQTFKPSKHSQHQQSNRIELNRIESNRIESNEVSRHNIPNIHTFSKRVTQSATGKQNTTHRAHLCRPTTASQPARRTDGRTDPPDRTEPTDALRIDCVRMSTVRQNGAGADSARQP